MAYWPDMSFRGHAWSSGIVLALVLQDLRCGWAAVPSSVRAVSVRPTSRCGMRCPQQAVSKRATTSLESSLQVGAPMSSVVQTPAQARPESSSCSEHV